MVKHTQTIRRQKSRNSKENHEIKSKIIEVKNGSVTDIVFRFSRNVKSSYSMEHKSYDKSFCRSCKYIPQLFQIKAVPRMTLKISN